MKQWVIYYVLSHLLADSTEKNPIIIINAWKWNGLIVWPFLGNWIEFNGFCLREQYISICQYYDYVIGWRLEWYMEIVRKYLFKMLRILSV